MEKSTRTYKPIEIANMFLLHPNTIRFYEKMGFISKASRASNGYRQYTDKHILQLKIVRHIFSYPFTNHHIRDKGSKLIKKVAEDNLIESIQYADDYIECINKEIEQAESTVHLLKDWAQKTQRVTTSTTQSYTRKEVASIIGTTTEAVRNWERNALIKTEQRGENNQVLFQEKELQRMRIIYMLRQTGYSMSAIHRCLALYDEGINQDLRVALNRVEQEELLSAGDEWNNQLKKVKQGAEKIPLLIEEISQLIQ